MNTVGQIIAAYRKKAGLSQKELAQRLQENGIHISYKTVSGWEKDRFEPSVTVFLHLCRILGIPDCVEAFFGSNPNDPMSVLNERGRQKVCDYIDSLVHPENCVRQPEEPPVSIPAPDPALRKRLRLYSIRVSAGTGNFLDSDDYAFIDADAGEAGEADFAVTVTGDSMEPLFHSHDTVFVHRQDTLENGEIGIFALNENAYIKKLESGPDGTFLISLNPAYRPIPVREEDAFHIFGKVLHGKEGDAM